MYYCLIESAALIAGRPTAIDQELTRLLNQLADAGVPVRIVAFSEGNPLLRRVALNGARFAPGSIVIPYSSPLARQTLREALPATVRLISNENNPTDFINVLQGIDLMRRGNRLGGAYRMFGGYVGWKFDQLTGFLFTRHRMPRVR